MPQQEMPYRGETEAGGPITTARILKGLLGEVEGNQLVPVPGGPCVLPEPSVDGTNTPYSSLSGVLNLTDPQSRLSPRML